MGNSTFYKLRCDTVQPTGEHTSSIPRIRFLVYRESEDPERGHGMRLEFTIQSFVSRYRGEIFNGAMINAAIEFGINIS